MNEKLLFIDRDGTIILEPEDEQIDSYEKLQFYPGVIHTLHQICENGDFKLVMVTNQDGLGTDSFPEDTFWPAHNKMMEILKNEGIRFKAVHIDRSFENEGQDTRKPGTGMLRDYLTGSYDLENSYVIGDRKSDMMLAKNLGSKGILLYNLQRDDRNSIAPETQQEISMFSTNSWEEITDLLLSVRRTFTISRKTSETEVFITVNLDGDGKTNIDTGIAFFDHMLEQIARHGILDLEIKVTGDLHVDEHHTIEDTAIVLGEVINKALGDKKGIERYGFCLPMDDSLAQVAIDFGGRNWMEWEADFQREKIGEMPTEMFFHFFKSFSDSAKCNLNIKAEGVNEHHKIEAIFKAFAKAIKMAIRQDPGINIIPTTKGVL